MKSNEKKVNEDLAYEEDRIIRSILSPLREMKVPERIEKCILETCENIRKSEKVHIN